MTNNFVNETSYIYSTIVQNTVLKRGGYYLLTNLKEENFFHEIKWIGEVQPFFEVKVYAKETNYFSCCQFTSSSIKCHTSILYSTNYRKGKAVSVSSADLKIIFTDSDRSISRSNIEPGWTTSKKFTITNKSNET